MDNIGSCMIKIWAFNMLRSVFGTLVSLALIYLIKMLLWHEPKLDSDVHGYHWYHSKMLLRHVANLD